MSPVLDICLKVSLMTCTPASWHGQTQEYIWNIASLLKADVILIFYLMQSKQYLRGNKRKAVHNEINFLHEFSYY